MKKIFLLSIFALVLLAGCAGQRNEENPAAPDDREGDSSISGTYQLDTDASLIYWDAKKVVGGHSGTIGLQSGEISFEGGEPTQGSFVIDMDSVTVTDITEENSRQNLENHLKADDFFAVQDHPTARFDITRVTPYTGNEDYNYVIEGDLSLRGITKPQTVFADIAVDEETAQAVGGVKVDRTEYGMTFKSGKFFDDLGDGLIRDEFTLELDLVANRL
jgi:polyisoprenoid-binding protein YceI